MKHTLSRILLAAALALFAGDALAQQNVNITATVAKTCQFSGVTDVTFPTEYDPNDAAALDGTGEVVIQCTKGTTYYWTIDNGLNVGAKRRLTNGDSEYIPYSISGTSDGTTYAEAPIGMTVRETGAKSTGRAGDMSLGLLVSLDPLQDVSTDLGDFTDTVAVSVFVSP